MEKDEKEKVDFSEEDHSGTDPGIFVSEGTNNVSEETVSQKGNVVFEDENGAEILRVPIELKVNISCTVCKASDGDVRIITAIACPVLGSLKKFSDKIKDALIKYYMEVRTDGGKIDVLNDVLERFYKYLASYSAKFKVEGSDDVGFGSVEAKLDQETLTAP